MVKIKKTITCSKGGQFEFEGTPTQVYTQRVFMCPIHEDHLILPSGYHWRYIGMIREGQRTPQYLSYWHRLHSKRIKPHSLPYPIEPILGRANSVNLGQYEPYAGTFIASIVPVEERLKYIEERAKEVEARARELEVEEAPPVKPAIDIKKLLPWALLALAL